jgi:hypothetical protein
MIIKEESINGVKVYTVKKDMTDESLEKKLGTLLTDKSYSTIVDHDADVYTEDGKLLLRFRKNVLPKKNISTAYDNLIEFAKNKTSTRGTTSATKKGERNPGTNTPIMSNIIGYFDKWTIGQKHVFKVLAIKPPFKVRVSSYTTKYPEKWANVQPLITDIDRMYKRLNPVQHKKQTAWANQTAYRIPKTCFTTMTTNVNLQTACHTDSGDFKEGFGNLVVIEKGTYKGGYTIFPQYGVGVDVRTGDFLAMDVHQIHGNTKVVPVSKDAIRLSLVSYLREDVVLKSKGTTAAHVVRNITTMKRIHARFRKIKEANKLP